MGSLYRFVPGYSSKLRIVDFREYVLTLYIRLA
jgi:hypothetical protein